MPRWKLHPHRWNPAPASDLVVQKYDTVEGKGGEVTYILSRLLGPAPFTRDRFLDENKVSFRAQAAGA
ncbi:MAG: hypothetical protein WBQ89_06985 [Candidatus Acidiferrum sp.]